MQAPKKEDIYVLLVTTGIAIINIGIAFVAGLALYFHHPDSEVAALSGSRSSGKTCRGWGKSSKNSLRPKIFNRCFRVVNET